jgi:hypothetical protein
MLIVLSLRDEMLVISNFRASVVDAARGVRSGVRARSDWRRIRAPIAKILAATARAARR